MSSIPEIIADLEYGREQLFQAIQGLSRREMTQIPIYDDWTVKDVLAHIIGWDQWTLEILPLILQDQADQIMPVDPDSLNAQTLRTWRNKSLDEVLTTIKSTHRQILEVIAGLDHKEIDMRHRRGDRIITIRSYVINIMIDHERQHAEEIELWRESLDSTISPTQIKQALAQNRAQLLAAVDGLNEADVVDKNASDGWSVKDVLAHITAWEVRLLNGARHIVDPTQPLPPPINGIDAWNDAMAAQDAGRSWADVYADFIKTRQDVGAFLDSLARSDWQKRGPYPWPNNQGTVAELFITIAEHDAEHLPDLLQWRSQKIKGG